MNKFLLNLVSRLDGVGINFLRVAIFIVFAWIGGLKVCDYEAEGIVPFVANSPAMNFFYAKKAPEYKQYKHAEGAVVEKDTRWHVENRTYAFSYFLGAVIVSIGVLVLLGAVFPKLGIVGGALVFLMAITTLSFLITTPEVWVLGEFPKLSGAGRLVVKDVIMMAGAVCIMARDARRILRRD